MRDERWILLRQYGVKQMRRVYIIRPVGDILKSENGQAAIVCGSVAMWKSPNGVVGTIW